MLHTNGFSTEELEEKIGAIHSNIIGGMAAILNAMNTLGIQLPNGFGEVRGNEF